jgi:hypothetical protein
MGTGKQSIGGMMCNLKLIKGINIEKDNFSGSWFYSAMGDVGEVEKNEIEFCLTRGEDDDIILSRFVPDGKDCETSKEIISLYSIFRAEYEFAHEEQNFEMADRFHKLGLFLRRCAKEIKSQAKND